MKNMQTCMNSNLFEAPIWCSKEPILCKTCWNHGLNIIMNMHAPFYHEFNSKLINSNMHAWIMLYINMYELKHDLALQLKHESCKNNSKTQLRSWMIYLRCRIRSEGAQICKYTSISSKFQAILKVELNISPSPSLGRLSSRSELSKCLIEVYTRLNN